MQKITDHVQQALGRLMQQYKGQPNMEAFLTAMVNQIQYLENAVFDLDEGWKLYDGSTFPAVGAQLDVIGELVGRPRNGLDDQQYLIFILGTIAENFSDSTNASLRNIIALLYNASGVYFRDVYPAGVAYTVNQPQLPETLFTLAKSLVQASLGAAVKINYAAKFQSPGRVPFRFSKVGAASTPGGGFGSTLSPNTGGQLVTL